MLKNFHHFWDSYVQFYLTNYSSGDRIAEEGLPYLRDKLFISILLIVFPLCLIAYVPSVFVCIKTKELVLGICDTVAVIALFYVFFSKTATINFRKLVFSLALYLLSVFILIKLGTRGPAIIILISLSLLITLFQGRTAGIISASLNTVIYFIILIVLPLASVDLKIFHDYSLISEIGVGVNIVVFNTIIVLSAGSIVDHLNESYLKERELQSLLKEESKELLESKLKAEESDRLKSAFLSNISHEIRTPMNGIIGFSYLISDPELNLDDRNEFIRLIQKSGDRMLNVINQIVDISRIEAGSMDLLIKEVNINEQVENVYRLMKPEADEKNILFSYKAGISNRKAIIKTDREKLETILINLVNNAIKFTDFGSIEIGYIIRSGESFLGSVYNSEDQDIPQEVFFYVNDTGIGIPADRLKAIFNSFIQADIYDREAREGLGLGLSIAKSYVEMLGGKMGVESESGKGSSFYFTIPCNVKEEPEGTLDIILTNDLMESEALNLNILIAEDDEISSLLLGQMVSKISKNTIYADNGREAVEACRSNPDIDLILMDIRMPEMDGLEATKLIRQFNTRVIIIAQTAFVMAGEKTMALDAGCNDFISKPVIEEELLNMIQLNSRNMQNKKTNIRSEF
jgi:signal transduction histidine kinase/CheY-like chemotaxis protein